MVSRRTRPARVAGFDGVFGGGVDVNYFAEKPGDEDYTLDFPEGTDISDQAVLDATPRPHDYQRHTMSYVAAELVRSVCPLTGMSRYLDPRSPGGVSNGSSAGSLLARRTGRDGWHSKTRRGDGTRMGGQVASGLGRVPRSTARCTISPSRCASLVIPVIIRTRRPPTAERSLMRQRTSAPSAW